MKSTAQLKALMEANPAYPCTGCRSCESHCSQKLPIPDYVALLNELKEDVEKAEELKGRYLQYAAGRGRATDCMFCHSCENNCPEQLGISDAMFLAAKVFE